MKRFFTYIFVGFFSIFFSCNDGDLTIETVSFTGQEAYSCTSDLTTDFVFKTQGKEAVILMFPRQILENVEQNLTGNIPQDFKFYYRSFDNSVSSSYFCSTPPLTSPKVISEISALGGKVNIETKKILDNQGNVLRYNHQITIKDLVIKNEKGEQLIDSNFIFGTYQTNP